jgi:LysR family hydrogen peroxide-inducible transcriptional activator
LWLAFGADFEIGGREQVTFKEINVANLLLLEQGHCLRSHALDAVHKSNSADNILLQGTSLTTLIQMVDNGLGETIVPKMAIDGGIARGTKVNFRPIFGKDASRQIGFAWRKASPRIDEFKLLAECFQAELATPVSPNRRSA